MSFINNTYPTGPAGGQLSGSYANPSVAGITETTGPTHLSIGDIADGEVLMRDGNQITGGTVIGGDEQVKVSAADTAQGYLNEKIVAGTNISLTILSPGGDEQFQINVTGINVTRGIATINFGNGNGASDLSQSSVDILSSNVSSTTVINVSIRPETTAEHELDEVIAENMRLIASPTAGVGFTVYANILEGSSWGNFKIDWSY